MKVEIPMQRDNSTRFLDCKKWKFHHITFDSSNILDSSHFFYDYFIQIYHHNSRKIFDLFRFYRAFLYISRISNVYIHACIICVCLSSCCCPSFLQHRIFLFIIPLWRETIKFLNWLFHIFIAPPNTSCLVAFVILISCFKIFCLASNFIWLFARFKF